MSQASMITLRHLNIFVSLYENKGNMTRTAENCYIAQPAISLALSELEDMYNCRLFDRISRKLYINEAGTKFYGFARNILNMMEDMDRGMKDVVAGSSLRIGSCDSMDARRLPHYVAQFGRMNPDVRVRSTAQATESLIGKVLSNELDLAFIDRKPGSKKLVAEQFGSSTLALAASPELGFLNGQKLTAKELSELPLLLREQGSGMREAIDKAMEKRGCSTDPVYEGAGNGCVLDAALAGMGIAVLPEKMLAEYLRRGELVRLEAADFSLEINYYVIYHKDKDLSENAAAFLEMCRDYEEQKQAEAELKKRVAEEIPFGSAVRIQDVFGTMEKADKREQNTSPVTSPAFSQTDVTFSQTDRSFAQTDVSFSQPDVESALKELWSHGAPASA